MIIRVETRLDHWPGKWSGREGGVWDGRTGGPGTQHHALLRFGPFPPVSKAVP